MAGKNVDHSKMLSTRLGQAIHNNELENVRMYIEQGADINRQCNTEMSEVICPLELACYYGHEEVIQELLNAGADPNQVTQGQRQPPMFLAAERHVLTLSIMRCLISHGADVNLRNNYGENILHMLAIGRFNDTNNNFLSAAKLAMDNGASFYARNERDNTPLYWACKYGNIDLVKLFLAEGADVNFNVGRMSMLTGAAEGCNIDMFDMLINESANRHLTPYALTNICFKNDHAMIARILDTCDMYINMPIDHYGGMTILQYACDDRYITIETVRLLLDRGADVRAVSDTGNTALHYAAETRRCDKIRQLLSYNPPLNIKNNDNQTPLAKLIEPFLNSYSLSLQQAYTQDQRDYYTNVYQVSLVAFKMLVTAGAKVTADDEDKLNQFRIKYPDAHIPDHEIRSTRSLKELCRFVIRGAIAVPVNVSLCKLPIPKLLQEYFNFPELDLLVNEYNMYLNILKERGLEYLIGLPVNSPTQ